MPKCKSCKAEIKWVTMASGKKMPLSVPAKSMVLIKDDIGEIVSVYTPHWADCPGAAGFRKAKS